MTITRLHPGKRSSWAVKHGNTLYLAGQVADDTNGGIEQRTRDVLSKIDRVLDNAGASKCKVLSCQLILSNIGDFAAMNSVYDAWIDPANPPTRACAEARLATPDLKVEIIAIAALD